MAGKRIALVTGASSGMGKAIAQQLMDDGLTVIAAARSVDKMQDLKTRGAHVIRLDVSDEESITSAMAEIEQAYGDVDVLVNNAGFGLYGAIENISLEDARYQFAVNLFGPARLTQLVLPGMRAKRAGKIINISSMGGKMYTPLGAWYHASKHALEGWSDCLRLEVRQFGIDVVIVEPGAIKTNFNDVMMQSLLKSAGAGPYHEMAQKMVNAGERGKKNGGTGSKPEVIAKVVSEAIKAKRPRTRYAAGMAAKPLIWVRKHVSDRMFDRIAMLMIR